MEYSKRIVILTNPLGDSDQKGILSMEQTGSNLKCVLKTFSLRPDSNAVLGIMLGGTMLSPVNVLKENISKFDFNLNNSLKIGGEIAIMLAEKEEGNLIPLLFGGAECEKQTVESFLKNLKNFGKLTIEEPEILNEKFVFESETKHQTQTKTEDKQKAQQLEIETAEVPEKQKKDFTCSPIIKNNVSSAKESEEVKTIINSEMQKQFSNGETKTIIDYENSAQFESSEDEIEAIIDSEMQKQFESDAVEISQQQTTQPPFFTLVEDQIEKMFLTYPKNETLERIIENSRWANVDYDGNGMFYALGLIYEEGTDIKYICYAVPAKGSQKPPEDIAEFCQWLPVDENNAGGEGYFIMFQNARTGESVNLAI